MLFFTVAATSPQTRFRTAHHRAAARSPFATIFVDWQGSMVDPVAGITVLGDQDEFLATRSRFRIFRG